MSEYIPEIKKIEFDIKKSITDINNMMRTSRLTTQAKMPWFNGTWISEKDFKEFNGMMTMLKLNTEVAVRALNELKDDLTKAHSRLMKL